MTAWINVTLPGHDHLTVVSNPYCADRAAAERWLTWKVRQLEAEGFDVADTEIT